MPAFFCLEPFPNLFFLLYFIFFNLEQREIERKVTQRGGERQAEVCSTTSPLEYLRSFPPVGGGWGLEPSSLVMVVCTFYQVCYCPVPPIHFYLSCSFLISHTFSSVPFLDHFLPRHLKSIFVLHGNQVFSVNGY